MLYWIYEISALWIVALFAAFLWEFVGWASSYLAPSCERGSIPTGLSTSFLVISCNISGSCTAYCLDYWLSQPIRNHSDVEKTLAAKRLHWGRCTEMFPATPNRSSRN